MSVQVTVIGGGPAGLASAAMVRKKGISAVVLDRADHIGASWMSHYDRLHLHTTRALSGLPGLPIPRSEGRWVSRDGVVRYLNAYVAKHDLDVRTGIEAKGLERRTDRWSVQTSEGEFEAPAVVVATGYNKEPILPQWPGKDDFAGRLIHSSAYKNPSGFEGSKVLVVGSGNSGAEIAVDLARGGAGRVWLSIRRTPHILLRSVLGTPTQAVGVVLRHLPEPLVNTVSATTARLTVGDLSPYGIPKPDKGMLTRVREDDAIPVLDVGLIDALKEGIVTVVPAVESFEGPEVLFADGSRIDPDHVIAATGYRRALEELVPDDLIDERGRPVVHGPETAPGAPNLHFIGYTNPISGNLRELGIDAKRIARALAKNLASRTP